VTVTELGGDQLALLDVWEGAVEVYVVDAICSGGDPGTVRRFDASFPLGDGFQHRGTHLFSLADVIELARALHRLPARLTGYGIEGRMSEMCLDTHGPPRPRRPPARLRSAPAVVVAGGH
jgi:hydrogenase maturation protease